MKQNRTFPVIGITGGAGCGKTTVIRQLEACLPARFLHCDEIGHELMQPGGATYRALVQEYGDGILEQGRISRERLGRLAYATEEAHERLNAITHPLIRAEVERRLQQLSKQRFDGIVFLEAALLFESGFHLMCDEVWYVHAPLADRVRRLKEDRGYSEEKIAAVLEHQLSEQEFEKRSDFVIENPDGGSLPMEAIRRRLKSDWKPDTKCDIVDE